MRRERPRGPAAAHAVLAVALLVLLATLALRQHQPPPPQIAEFAPQAAEQITESPTDQAGRIGRGAGSSSPAPTASVSGVRAALEPVVVPRVRRCVGDPPRQVEDPQSPPCVPYWSGDNGGTTTKGVTRDEIRLAIPTTQNNAQNISNPVVAFFNKRFEFYGRQLHVITYVAQGGNGDAARMSADAATLDEDLNVFAALAYGGQNGASSSSTDGRESRFYDELARRGIISAQTTSHHGVSTVDEGHLAGFSPYQWNYLPSVDVDLRAYESFICASLAGRPAKYSGSPTMPRVFGVITQQYPDGTPPVDVEPLRPTCSNARLVEASWDSSAASATNAILQLRNAGVTSILCLCQRDQLSGTVMTSATGQRYFPEWLISNFGFQDDEVYGLRSAPAEHRAHAFGLMSFNKWQREVDQPIYWAFSEMTPNRTSSDTTWNYEAWTMYWNLLLIASGIQMAGPRLTPRTFGDALHRTRFPNPGCGAGPWYQACVGFARDHTMIDDVAVVWWSETNESVTATPYSNQPAGTFCYTRLGQRHRPGGFPVEDPPLFAGQCR